MARAAWLELAQARLKSQKRRILQDLAVIQLGYTQLVIASL